MESYHLVLLLLCALYVSTEARFFKRDSRDYDPFHRECGTAMGDRQACGRNANRLSELECRARACCWEKEPEGDSPGCFLPKRMLQPVCNVAYEDKDDCGYWDITEGECVARDCCYRPQSQTNEPNCFHKLKDGIKLADGPDEKSGRIEIIHEGTWGTVCDDMFGKDDADVICKSLGFASGEPKIEAFYGAGSGQIWLDSLECDGSEDAVGECDHGGWGVHDCSHGEDAGVKCLMEGEEDSSEGGDYGSGYEYEEWDYRSMKKPSK